MKIMAKNGVAISRLRDNRDNRGSREEQSDEYDRHSKIKRDGKWRAKMGHISFLFTGQRASRVY